MASGSSSPLRVDCSISVMRKVTVPVGRSIIGQIYPPAAALSPFFTADLKVIYHGPRGDRPCRGSMPTEMGFSGDDVRLPPISYQNADIAGCLKSANRRDKRLNRYCLGVSKVPKPSPDGIIRWLRYFRSASQTDVPQLGLSPPNRPEAIAGNNCCRETAGSQLHACYRSRGRRHRQRKTSQGH